jgi:hypothetical protein
LVDTHKSKKKEENPSSQIKEEKIVKGKVDKKMGSMMGVSAKDGKKSKNPKTFNRMQSKHIDK